MYKASQRFRQLLSITLIAVAATTVSANDDRNDTPAGLRLTTIDGQRLDDAVTMSTRVDIRITGVVARVNVKQQFRNPSQHWVEGRYLFPLPDDAAVDRMRMVYAEHVIEGEIRERGEAAKIYRAARDAGQRASLLNQQRANVFTSSVANIPPGEDILVEIEYQQAVQHSEQDFSIRFPMVVAPRYIPGVAFNDRVEGFSEAGWGVATDQVSDAPEITAPVVADAPQSVNSVQLQASLHSGLRLAALESLYHPIVTHEQADGSYRVSLVDDEVRADRDFVLRWRYVSTESPEAALFSERWGNDDYGLLMLMPPSIDTAHAEPPARELIMVVDTSGSMYGDSIEQARAALDMAIRRLRPQDRFNIIQFSNDYHSLFSGAVDATPDNVRRALAYVGALQADGGTEMLPAMRFALQDPRPSGLLRQVVFLTDGAIGNEQALFATIERDLARSRLFTVGIGAAPNSYFMTRAAEHGRGSFVYIGDLAEVQQEMRRLFARLERPVLTDVRLFWPEDTTVELAPRQIPDLYAGQPLLLALKAARMPHKVVLEADWGDRRWQREIVLHGGASRSGIHALWARRRIADAMAGLALGEDPADVRKAVLGLALTHHLVSRHTSLVAVDRTPVRPVGEGLRRGDVPSHLPKGWHAERIVGSMPRTATPMMLYLISGGLLSTLGIGLLGWRRRRG